MDTTNASTPHVEPGNGHASYEAPTSSLEALSSAPAPATAVAAPQPPPTASRAPVHAAAAAGGERCLTCGAVVAADQRYCLECGQRRGEPRLPFMDASSLMDAAVQRRRPTAAAPTPPRKRGGRVSANTALIAGVGTLLLALGIGVLIGRSGNQTGTVTTPTTQVLTLPSGSGEATTAETSTGPAGKSSAKKKSGGGEATAASKAGANGQSEAAEEVLKPVAGTKLPPPETKVGDKGSGPGYNKNHEFTGSFFGEE